MKKIGLLFVIIFVAWGITAQQRPPVTPAASTAPPAPIMPTSPAEPYGQQSPPTPPARPAAPAAKPAQAVPGVPNVPAIPPMDPLGDVMFPPDLILAHSREIMLTAEQKSFMRAEIQKTTSRFNELQWALHDSMEDLHQTLEANSVNDQQALGMLDKVLDIEREIKRLHFGLGIRLKNKLTPEQQERLQNIRMSRPWPVSPRPGDNQ
jgi:Spy/CpxP family protein refolding chaperone